MPSLPSNFNAGTPSSIPSSGQIAPGTANPGLQTFATSIYKAFGNNDIIDSLKNPQDVLTGNAFNVTPMVSFYTASTETTSSNADSNYFWNIYPTTTDSGSSTNPQFSISYGHRLGSGSWSGSNVAGASSVSLTPSRAIYGQYRNVLLNPGITQFSFGTQSVDDIIAINIYRQQYKYHINPGNWQITLSGSAGTSGSLSLIDSSGLTGSVIVDQILSEQYSYNVISGSIANGSYASDATIYGTVYPSLGIILLNPRAIDNKINIGLNTGSIALTGSNNIGIVYNAIVRGAYFTCRNEQLVHTNYYFVRAYNSEFNYSNNPTFITGSNQIKYASFINNPQVFITTVGLYDDNNRLLAVAKLSSPIQKSFVTEYTLAVKLAY